MLPGAASLGAAMAARARQSTRQPRHIANARHNPLEDPEKELYQNLWNHERLLPPYSSLVHGRPLRRWSRFVMALALYEAIYIPLQLFFREPIDLDVGEFRMPVAQIVLQYLIDCCFWFDICLRFNTTYISRAVEGNELVTDRQKIAQRYLRSDFSLDLLASTPCALQTARPPLEHRPSTPRPPSFEPLS